MNSIVSILDGLEKLAYKVLIWIIMIPRTIIKIILDPVFVRKYIHSELENGTPESFDEYISPMILFLVVTFLPAIALNAVPGFGVTPISPLGEINKENAIRFEVKATFTSNMRKLNHEFEWVISKECENGQVECDNKIFLLEKHNFKNGISIWDESNNDYVLTGKHANIVMRSMFVSEDYLDYKFNEDGVYRISIQARNFQSGSETKVIEEYISGFVVNISDVPGKTSKVGTYYVLEVGDKITFSPKRNIEAESKNLFTDLQKDETGFIALALLFLPLFFALATDSFKEHSITGASLKKSFYIQCYYFVPMTLALWATIYSTLFYTSDIPMSFDLRFYVFFAALSWFLVVETRFISEERQIKLFTAFLVLIFCLMVIVGMSLLYASIVNDPDILRKSAIWAYPIIVVSFIVVFIFRFVLKKLYFRKEKRH